MKSDKVDNSTRGTVRDTPRLEIEREANNYLRSKGEFSPNIVEILSSFKPEGGLKKYKIGVMMICVNDLYWQFAGQLMADMDKFFLPGHETDYLLWTDMPTVEDIDKKINVIDDLMKKPEDNETFFDILGKYVDAMYMNKVVSQQHVLTALKQIGVDAEFQANDDETAPPNILVKNHNEQTRRIIADASKKLLQNQQLLQDKAFVFEAEPVEWPFGTLMRYATFLQQEEKLREYDYIFYIDIDMRVVNYVGDEIIGEGLTMAEHPMYSIRREYVPPYEPNPDSSAYVPRLSQVLMENGKPRMRPLYAAGGFQGGKTDLFIDAMKTMKKSIDDDFLKNYIAIWNDESHWNKYLFDYKGPLIALSPSYVYPDSLINEYYVKLWGKNYVPRIVTLTKSFTTSKTDGEELHKRLNTM